MTITEWIDVTYKIAGILTMAITLPYGIKHVCDIKNDLRKR